MEPFWEIEKTLLGFLNSSEKKKKPLKVFEKKSLSNQEKYQTQVQEILDKGRNLFVLDLDDLDNEKFLDIKNLAYSNTLRFLKLLEKSINIMIKEKIQKVTKKYSESFFSESTETNWIKKEQWGYGMVKLNYNIILIPPSWFKISNFNFIGAQFIGKFIKVKGVIVYLDEPFYFIKEATYKCLGCGFKFSNNEDLQKMKLSFLCPTKKCRARKEKGKLFLNIKESIFETFQKIKIEENCTGKNIGKPSWALDVLLFGPTTKTCGFGEKIKVAGILLPEINHTNTRETLQEKFFLKALFLERNSLRNQLKEKKKKKEIADIFKDPQVYSRVAFSLAPFIYGFWDIKKAITLSLLGATSSKKTGSLMTKEGIDIFFTGSSGTGKSIFLKIISELGSPGFFINSSFGLRNQLNFEKKNSNFLSKFSPEIDIFPQKGVVCLDEIFDFRNNQQLNLFDFLSQSENFQEGSYLNKEKPKQVNIIASSSRENFFLFYFKRGGSKEFFSKFDLCFLSQSHGDFDFDLNLANHMINLYQNRVFDVRYKLIKKETLKFFFLEARKISPYFPESLFDLIIYNYIILRVQNSEGLGNETSVMILFSIFRLSKALARLRFHDRVCSFDIQEASRLIAASKSSFQILKEKKNFREQNKTHRKIYDLIRNSSIQKKKLILSLKNLETLVLTKGFSRQNFVDCIRFYENLNIWTINVSQGSLFFLI